MQRPASGEDRIIERYFKPLARHPAALGLGDDAACLAPRAGFDLVLTADTIVAGTHFFADDPAETIGAKALRVNLSDLAAKGAAPLGALLSLSMPGAVEEEWIAAFAEGLGRDCVAFACPLLGGDTTRTPGPLSISITAIGEVPAGRMIRRDGAQPGDLVVVSGTIGDAALALELKKRFVSGGFGALAKEQAAYLRGRYLLPEPRVPLASLLREHARAAMDVSDGLAGDLAKLAAASGVSARIETARLPLSSAAHDAIAAEPALIETVLGGGDDYEILAAIPPGAYAAMAEAAGTAGIGITAIGAFGEGKGVTVLGQDGRPLSIRKGSYSHF
jgi:thiamine-monophosphate kinase